MYVEVMRRRGATSADGRTFAVPIGKALEASLPDWGFTMFGSRHSLNPGKFSRKEHMLITIMANVAFSTPYTDNIIWVQYLSQ